MYIFCQFSQNFTGYPNNALGYSSTSSTTAIPFYGNSVAAPMGYTTSGVSFDLRKMIVSLNFT